MIGRRFRVRLAASYLAVVAAGSLAVWAVSRFVAPEEFQRRLRLAGQGRGSGSTTAQIQDLVVQSIDAALLVGIVAGIAASGIVAFLVSRRVLRPIDSIRGVAAQMAQGDYQQRVPIPAEEELAALAESVNTLASSLEETELRRTRLIGEVAHELRTPLTTIGGYMEALLDGVREPDAATFAAVAEEASRLHRLADDLTLLSQAEEGAISLDRSPEDLADLLRTACEYLQPQFADAGVDLVVDARPAAAEVDRDRIMQVLVNLLGNALAHTTAGGTVTAGAGEDREAAWVEIVDSGAGIPTDQLEHIFERFYRLSTADRPAGRGIGLTIARSIARAHDGDIVADSAGPGTGATFRLTIPTS